MHLDITAIADYANVAAGDKLNINGIFDTIGATNFPARQPSMVFVLRMRTEWEDSEKEFDVRITLEDEDGQRSLEIQGKLTVGKVPPGMFGNVNQILQLRDVVFGRAGQYVFRVTIDGKEVRRHPLNLVEVESGQQ